MPRLHKYRDRNACYVLTAIRGAVVTFQLTAEGEKKLTAARIGPGEQFPRAILLDLYRTGDAIVQRLQQRLTKDGDGLIVLMHLGSARVSGDRPTDGLGAFMDRALQEGWTFVSAGSLLHDLGKPTWDPHQRLALLNSSPTPSH